jgi:hypothetical protein
MSLPSALPPPSQSLSNLPKKCAFSSQRHPIIITHLSTQSTLYQLTHLISLSDPSQSQSTEMLPLDTPCCMQTPANKDHLACLAAADTLIR